MALFKTRHCKDSENCEYAHTREQLRALPGGSDKPEKILYGPAKGRLTMPKPPGQSKSGNADTPSPKPRLGSRTTTPPGSLPSSPQPHPIAPGVWLTAVPVHVLGIPAGMEVAADGQLVMRSPPGTPIQQGGVQSAFGLPPWSPLMYAAMPYTPCEEPAISANSPISKREQPHSAEIPFCGLSTMQVKEKTTSIKEPETSDSDSPPFLPLSLTEPEKMSDTSTNESEDRDESFTSAGSDDFPVPEGFEVSIKNTFLDVAPKTPSKRNKTQSVPRKLSGSGTPSGTGTP